jgi:uncharacterized protein
VAKWVGFRTPWLSAFVGSNPTPRIKVKMEGIRNLGRLLKEMKPELVNREYVFCTLPEDRFSRLEVAPLLTYREKEGVTLILEREIADANSLAYSGVWALITLTVNSDLLAVGFLARIANKLAEAGISINVVSAYYHDHLFVPVNLAEKAMGILRELSR